MSKKYDDRGYCPTGLLRFVERPMPVPGTGMVDTVKKVKILQQHWERIYSLPNEPNRVLTAEEWRDVPFVVETSND